MSWLCLLTVLVGEGHHVPSPWLVILELTYNTIKISNISIKKYQSPFPHHPGGRAFGAIHFLVEIRIFSSKLAFNY